LGSSRLDERDRGFVTELVYGSLRRQGELDVVIAHLTNREVGEIEPEVLEILRLGTYQLLFMRVPSHAAVDESVTLAKVMGLRRASGFINGVLRNVTRNTSEHWQEIIDQDSSSTHSHPAWIVEELRKALEETGDGAELEDALRANNERPLVCVVCLPGLSQPGTTEPRTPYSPFGVTLAGGDPARDARIASGAARVQDEGSQLATLALMAVSPIDSSTRFLDMCAGPGGKTALLGATALEAGASVVALESVPQRARLVENSVRAISGLDSSVITVQVADSRRIEGTFERILLDAPCSGLGALRRRPEARWRKSPEQLAGLNQLQSELLDAGLTALAPGGVLAYVTCSPVVSETTEIIGGALGRHSDISALDTAAVLDSVTRVPVPGSRRGSAVQLWTHRHDTDSMFIQLLRKVPAV
jgi:16S rRNA (cytosine967-C5)-methyltransferase